MSASYSFLNGAEVVGSDSRFARLFSVALTRIPTEVSPVRSIRRIVLRRRARKRGMVGLTTYSDGPGSREEQTMTFYLDLLDQLSDPAYLAVIAHELAHAWLNEHVRPMESKEREKEADSLAAHWGFGAELAALDREAYTL